MLKGLNDLEDDDQRIGYWLSNIRAYDPETQADLRVSHGRRRLGSPARWWVDMFDGSFNRGWNKTKGTPDNPPGEYLYPSKTRVFGLTAYTLTEAIEKANKRLERWLKDVTDYRDTILPVGTHTLYGGQIVTGPQCGKAALMIDDFWPDWNKEQPSWHYQLYIHTMHGPRDDYDIEARRLFPLIFCYTSSLTPEYITHLQNGGQTR